jgi:serine/threonine protein kinase
MSDEGLRESLREGTMVGRYRILRPIAEGGMSIVYEAEHVDLQRSVALKIIRASYAGDPTLIQRFVLEARAASRLRHPHVVQITDMGFEGGRAFLVMDLLVGEDLSTLLEREGPLGVELAVDILLPIASAVAAAHAEGIVHRDLKPENVFVSRGSRGRPHPVLIDFGVARRKLVAPRLTRANELVGTPLYMAPEQVEGGRELDERADGYALGSIIYHAVTGTPPYRAGNLMALFAAIQRGGAPPPSHHRPGLPSEFDGVVLRAMAASPEERFASARDLGRALWPFASSVTRTLWAEEFGRPSLTPMIPPSTERPRRPPATTRPPPAAKRERTSVSVAALKELGLFSDCPDAAVEEFLGRTGGWLFPAGSGVLAEGANAHAAYLLLRGEVEVIKSVTGSYFRLGTLRAGDVFGHGALVARGSRTVSIVAMSDAVSLRIGGDVFESMMCSTDATSQALRSLVVVSGIRQLRRATHRLATLLDRGEGASSAQELLYLQSAVREWSLPIAEPDSA